MKNPLSSVDVNHLSLIKLFEVERTLNESDRKIHLNSFLASLSGFVPMDIWERAIETGNRSVTFHRLSAGLGETPDKD